MRDGWRCGKVEVGLDAPSRGVMLAWLPRYNLNGDAHLPPICSGFPQQQWAACSYTGMYFKVSLCVPWDASCV